MDALPNFSLVNASTVDDVVRARAAHGDSKLIGGGTDLVVNIRRGIVAPPTLIDVNHVAELRAIKADAHVLEMVPRRKQMAEGIDRLRIWIDRSRLVMTRMVLDYPGGDSKTLELHDIRTNVAIDESVFGLLARKRMF